MSARLEILHIILNEFGINEQIWNWQVVFQKLVGPSFSHQNPDVRLQAAECTLTFYNIIGPAFRQEVLQIPNLKQNILDQLFKRMDAIDVEKGGSVPQLDRSNPPGKGSPYKQQSSVNRKSLD